MVVSESREKERTNLGDQLCVIFGRLSLSGELCSFSVLLSNYVHGTRQRLLPRRRRPLEGRHGIDQHSRRHQMTKNSSDSHAPTIANTNQTTAAMAGNISSTGNALGHGKYREKRDKYGCASNCDKVTVPKVNPEIWNKLTHQAKRRDLRVAAIQKAVTKVRAILTCSASKIMAALADSKNSNITSNLEELLTFTTDAIALLGDINQSFSQHRRDLIRPCLNKEYSALCLPHTPITGKLFGDELQSQVNSIKASDKIRNLRPVLLVAAFTRNLAITTGKGNRPKGKETPLQP